MFTAWYSNESGLFHYKYRKDITKNYYSNSPRFNIDSLDGKKKASLHIWDKFDLGYRSYVFPADKKKEVLAKQNQKKKKENARARLSGQFIAKASEEIEVDTSNVDEDDFELESGHTTDVTRYDGLSSNDNHSSLEEEDSEIKEISDQVQHILLEDQKEQRIIPTVQEVTKRNIIQDKQEVNALTRLPKANAAVKPLKKSQVHPQVNNQATQEVSTLTRLPKASAAAKPQKESQEHRQVNNQAALSNKTAIMRGARFADEEKKTEQQQSLSLLPNEKDKKTSKKKKTAKKTSGNYRNMDLNNVLNDEEQFFMEEYDRNKARGGSESSGDYLRYLTLLRRIHDSFQ